MPWKCYNRLSIMPRRVHAGDPPLVNPPEGPTYLADLEWARAVVAGDPNARKRFADHYGEKVLQAAYIWCRPFCPRDCTLRRAGIHRLMQAFLRQNCDQVLEGYAYLLDQLENVVLNRYRGEAALSSFLFSVIHPDGAFFHRYRIEFVRFQKGKVVLPVWADNLPDWDRKVLYEMLLGSDPEEIALQLKADLEEVQLAVVGIRHAACKAGWNKYWGYLMSATAREIQIPLEIHEDGEAPQEQEMPDPENLEERILCDMRKAQLGQALSELDSMAETVLRLRYLDGISVAQIAIGLGRDRGEINKIEVEAKEHLRKFFFSGRGSGGSDLSV